MKKLICDYCKKTKESYKDFVYTGVDVNICKECDKKRGELK